VHLFGFIIRTGHNARSHELKIHGISQTSYQTSVRLPTKPQSDLLPNLSQTSYQTSGIELQMKHGSCLPYHFRFNITVSFQPVDEAVNRRAQICLITIP